MLDTHILGTMTVDPANGTRLEGETATLTRDLLLEVLREAESKGLEYALNFDEYKTPLGANAWKPIQDRIEALPDSEDEG